MIRFFKFHENIGAIFAILAFFLFAILDVFQKYGTIFHTVFQIMLCKYLFLFFLSLIESVRKNNKNFWKTNNLKLQFLRSVLSLLESGFFILSFKYLSLASAHSIQAFTPLIVIVLAFVFLKEKIDTKTWIAVACGFIGVIIILRPGLGIFDIKILIPLIGAFFLSLYQIITRLVSYIDENETSLFFTSIIGVIIMSLLVNFYWIDFSSQSFFIFMGIGIFYSLGYYCQVIALSKSPANKIQPFHFTSFFWAVIFGFIFYNDIPDKFTLIGAIVIIISGIYALKFKRISN
tara:strand:+ start:98 stop:967 length:870 start_codon:yes stop_codon:yes gene_type:complete